MPYLQITENKHLWRLIYLRNKGFIRLGEMRCAFLCVFWYTKSMICMQDKLGLYRWCYFWLVGRWWLGQHDRAHKQINFLTLLITLYRISLVLINKQLCVSMQIITILWMATYSFPDPEQCRTASISLGFVPGERNPYWQTLSNLLASGALSVHWENYFNHIHLRFDV